MTLERWVRVGRATFAKWGNDNGWLYAAAMAAFAALALAPLLLVALRVAEIFGAQRTVIRALALVVDPIVGRGGVRTLDEAFGGGLRPHGSWITIVLAILLALFSGSRLFYATQRALHAIWNTPLNKQPTPLATVTSFLAAAVLSVLAIAGITFAIFGSAALTSAIQGTAMPVTADLLAHGGVAMLGALIVTPLCAALFRWLPGAELHWSDVWLGSAATGIACAAAQFFIAIYLSAVNLPWTYGSAASLIVILLWLYYSSYVFLLGAEFTYAYSNERRSEAAVAISGSGLEEQVVSREAGGDDVIAHRGVDHGL